ncbi:MAG: DUF421 domain-containing protein [Clostridia bacterium]|nr:DUF421 domain-containing protein [Clostridia bacterium]
MDILNILFSALGSIIALFIITKLIGNKQMSQLDLFDYINGITIGSIAAEMATSLEGDFLKPLVAMTVYGLVVFIISILVSKSISMRRLFVGRSVLLYDKGKIYDRNFTKARININEFLNQCRVNGYFNLADLETAIMEPDGRISFLPKAELRPVTPQDLQITPQQERPVYNVILDGYILEENLKSTGNNPTWLMNELAKQKIKHVEDVFLATCDANNHLSVYYKVGKKPSNDKFQ